MITVGLDASNLRAGGGLTHLVEILRAADATPTAFGIKQVIVWGGRQTLDRLPQHPWLTCVHQPILDKGLAARAAWQQLVLPRLARQSVDLLYVPGGGSGGSFQPSVTMSRNMLPFMPSERQRYGYSKTGIRLAILRQAQAYHFKRAAAVIFLTEYARKTVLEATGPLSAEVTTIPHGVDDRFRLAPRPTRAVSTYSEQQPFRWLYVSIIDEYKHQWHVAEAIASVKKSGLPVSLDLVGPAYAPAMARLQQTLTCVDPRGEFIRYHGPIANAQLQQCYHEADGFIFASSCENMPNILVESMAAGLPIACSERQPMPEILGDAGLYFNPEQPDSLAAVIQQYMADDDLREHCAARAFARAQQFSWTRCAKATFAFLRQVYDDCHVRS